MKMIAHVNGFEARFFRRHRIFQQLLWRILFGARFPTEFDGHALLLAFTQLRDAALPCARTVRSFFYSIIFLIESWYVIRFAAGD